MPFSPHIFCLMGPTASGKSDIAFKIAKHFPCEIVSVDSVMVYRGMDIGTAKPSHHERHEIPHHLIDICDPSESYSAAEFCVDAKKIIHGIVSREHYPLLVGGTLLYFRALQEGLSALPSADPNIRQRLMREGKECGWNNLHTRLQKIDPVAAARIKEQDQQRIQRALEVYEITGNTLTELWQKNTTELFPYPCINMVLSPSDRQQLHENIAMRFIRMLEAGFIDEVAKLFQRSDLSASLPAIRAVGYRQVWQYLSNEISESQMKEKAIAATRQYAKRQLTWLRSLKDVMWFDSLEDGVLEKMVRYIAKELQTS